jgi:hypothetical protein
MFDTLVFRICTCLHDKFCYFLRNTRAILSRTLIVDRNARLRVNDIRAANTSANVVAPRLAVLASIRANKCDK